MVATILMIWLRINWLEFVHKQYTESWHQVITYFITLRQVYFLYYSTARCECDHSRIYHLNRLSWQWTLLGENVLLLLPYIWVPAPLACGPKRRSRREGYGVGSGYLEKGLCSLPIIFFEFRSSNRNFWFILSTVFTIQLLVLPWSWRVFAAEMYYFDFWGYYGKW